MIDYELALKLKAAGFPQGDNPRRQMLREEGDPYKPNNRTMWVKYFTPEYLEEMKDKIVYIPTLEELILACGDKFYGLHRLVDGSWMAFMFDIKDSTRQVETKGLSPEESVAKLWLALKNEN